MKAYCERRDDYSKKKQEAMLVIETYFEWNNARKDNEIETV